MNPTRCKNCKHYTWTIEGDAWCSKKICYTNNDGCCSEFKRSRCNIFWQIVALAIPFVALALLIIKVIANG